MYQLWIPPTLLGEVRKKPLSRETLQGTMGKEGPGLSLALVRNIPSGHTYRVETLFSLMSSLKFWSPKSA